MKKLKKKLLFAGSIVFAAGYALYVNSIFSYRHLPYTPGRYGPLVEGHYVNNDSNRIQKPNVLGRPVVELVRGEDGQMVFVNAQAEPLHVAEAKDGWYFSQEMQPVGAKIFPGLSRFWSEGQVTVFEDKLDFRGYTLERGLTFFVIPYSKVMLWQVTLQPQPDLPEAAD